MKKKSPTNLYLHGDKELDKQIAQSNHEQISSSQTAQAITSELEALQGLFSKEEFVEDSEAFVRATMQRLDQPGLIESLGNLLQGSRSTLEWSFASIVLLLGVVLTQENPLTSSSVPLNSEEETSFSEEFEDQELIQAFEQEYSLMNTELQIFDLGEV